MFIRCIVQGFSLNLVHVSENIKPLVFSFYLSKLHLTGANVRHWDLSHYYSCSVSVRKIQPELHCAHQSNISVLIGHLISFNN